jgi:type IV secretory pathway TrbL component
MRPLLILTAIFFSIITQAQVTVSGFARDTKGNPVAGVRISLKDTYDGAVTDST